MSKCLLLSNNKIIAHFVEAKNKILISFSQHIYFYTFIYLFVLRTFDFEFTPIFPIFFFWIFFGNGTFFFKLSLLIASTQIQNIYFKHFLRKIYECHYTDEMKQILVILLIMVPANFYKLCILQFTFRFITFI